MSMLKNNEICQNQKNKKLIMNFKEFAESRKSVRGFLNKPVPKKLIDEIIKIDDDEAFYYGRLLARLEGLLSGISSGAALAATIKIGKRKELMNKRLIVILPSFGERYLSTAMFESNTSIQARKDGYL